MPKTTPRQFSPGCEPAALIWSNGTINVTLSRAQIELMYKAVDSRGLELEGQLRPTGMDSRQVPSDEAELQISNRKM